MHQYEYKSLSQSEHVLHRSDMHIGISSNISNRQLIFDFETNKIINQKILHNPGLIKIFDEALMNARDHTINDNTCDRIDVELDEYTGMISVKNNGSKPIPIENDLPKQLFSKLRMSSNFDDTKENITAGKNGVGITLANIWSKEFKVEVQNQNRLYSVLFTDNMSICGQSTIIDNQESDYVKVSFIPDYERFQTSISDNIGILTRKVYDLKFTTDVTVSLNGTILSDEYPNLLTESDTQSEIITYKDQRWTITIIISEHINKYQTISFVNGIKTNSIRSSEVQYVETLIWNAIQQYYGSQYEFQYDDIKNKFYLLINATVINATYTSQSKECLQYVFNKNKYQHSIPQTFIKQLIESPIIQYELKRDLLKNKQKKSLLQFKKIDKYFQATDLDNKKPIDTNCKLFLTEGDSASSFIIKGLSDTSQYGAYSLKGKPLNVTKLCLSQKGMKRILENEQIENIIQIIGLEHDTDYEVEGNYQQLRYKQVIIGTDQDVDGSQICGLIINIFHRLFPSLLKRTQFFRRLITPIIVIKDNKSGDILKQYFSQQEYDQDTQSRTNILGDIYYAKGLGFWSDKYSSVFMQNINQYTRDYHYDSVECLDLAFDQSLANKRKEWINAFNQDIQYINYEKPSIGYKEFINNELIHHSIYNIQRAITAIDGFKVSQRKIVYAMMLRPKNKQDKVERLSSYIANTTQYHHGEVSLQEAMVKLAQDFVGSNNINLLDPLSQFGSRKDNGKVHGQARYIQTRLSEACYRYIFNKIDFNEQIIDYVYDEGQKVEPKLLPTIVPLVLINGQLGIGTGYQTNIPSHNPIQIIQYIINKLNNNDSNNIDIWYRGFKGTIDQQTRESFGLYKIKSGAIIIQEIPIGYSIQSYEQDMKQQQSVLNVSINDINEINIDIKIEHKHFLELMQNPEQLISYLKLKTKIPSNMTIIDAHGKIVRYSDQYTLIDDFIKFRLPIYAKRKQYIINKLTLDILIISNKIRFIQEQKNINFKTNIIEQLRTLQYYEHSGSFDYLLNMTIMQQLPNRIQKLEDEKQTLQDQYDTLMNTDPKDIWISELQKLEQYIQKSQ